MTAMQAIQFLESKNEPIIIGVVSGQVEYGQLLYDWGKCELPRGIALRVYAKATRADYTNMCEVLGQPNRSNGTPQESYYKAKMVAI